MDYLRARNVAAIVALIVCAWSPAWTTSDPAPAAFLHQYIRASDAELRRLDAGEAITHTLQSSDSREITTFGAIRVACTADRFAARVLDVERFKAGAYLLQIGRFGAQPRAGDVAALTMDDDDRRALRTCRPGACALRLPADAMSRLRETIPWGTPAEADVAADEMRAFILRQAAQYSSGGLRALADYGDKDSGLPRWSAFRGLLRPSTFTAEYQPQMFDFLDRFPDSHRDGIESFLYWSREHFGLKPIIAITHSALLRRDGVVVFASKQVYTSHYFDASLGMSLFIPAPGQPYGYLTYMNRSRIEGLHGPLAAVVRAIASRRGRDGLERTLHDVRKKLEEG